MSRIFIGIVIGVFLVVCAYYGRIAVRNFFSTSSIISPVGKILEKPLDKYTISGLSGRVFAGGAIILDEAIATTSASTAYTFHFESDNKKVTGVAHIPTGASEENKKAVIVQFRGYMDQETYKPGAGTRRSAEVFAANGYISLAPDFLGFGESDMPSEDVFEQRFETYTTALNLLSSVDSLPMADSARIGIWGHSNGGQIALTVLEILGRPIPTTLWAPVSKPFPYSILYYTDEAEDRGKLLRRALAKFEESYDVELYSLTNYLSRVRGPVQIHQGLADDAIPREWTDQLASVLKKQNGDIVSFFTYPGSNHDMVPSWNTVIARDVSFFQKYLR